MSEDEGTNAARSPATSPRKRAKLHARLAKARDRQTKAWARLGEARDDVRRLEVQLRHEAVADRMGDGVAGAGLHASAGASPRAAARRRSGAARRVSVGSPEDAESVRAAIDLGSNSVHLLVASVAGHDVDPIADDSAFLGLGEAAAEGAFGPELRAQVVDAVGQFVELAREHRAASMLVAATAPFRRATDGREALRAIEREIGVTCHVLGHEEEALATFLGVTGGLPVGEPTLVADLGGGSTDLALARPREPVEAIGFQVGTATLTSDVRPNDPPTGRDRAALREAAAAALGDLPWAPVPRLVVAGGTARNVLRLLPEGERSGRLDRGRLDRAMDAATDGSATTVAQRRGIRPARARMLPAGIALLDALLARVGTEALDVSATGLREGLVLAGARAGDRWFADLPTLANGWRPQAVSVAG